jgi:hypothetical protein
VYSVECKIQLTEFPEIGLELISDKENVKSSCEMIENLLQSVEERTFNKYDTDQQSNMANLTYLYIYAPIFQ